MSEDAGGNALKQTGAGDHEPTVEQSAGSPLLSARIGAASRAITSRDPGEIARILTESLGWVPPIRAAGLWLIEPGGQRARRQAWCGETGLAASERATTSLSRTAFGQLARRSDAIQVDGNAIAREILPAHQLSERDAATFAAFPLTRGALRLGILGLFSRRRLTEQEVALVMLVVRQAAAEMSASHATPNAPTAGEAPVNFISLTAHELRTPLTGLRGNIQLASMAIRKGEYSRVASRLDAALRLVDGIAALVQNLQDISRIERGAYTLSFGSADLTAAIWAAAQRIERSVPSDQHAIRVVAPEPIVTVHDTRQMEQVFYNLLTNAVTYSPEGGAIEVTAERAGDTVVVSITDQGIGIPPEEQQRIFAPYYRGATATMVNAKGLGIGLAISLATVERHGGSIEVRSRPGEGSTFIVRVPRVPPGQQTT